MKKKFLLISGLVLVVAGVVFGYLANFAMSDIISFSVTMFGAGLAAAAMYEKRDVSKSPWFCVLCIALVGIGAMGLGFAGFAEKTMTSVITSVFSVITIIAGIVVSVITSTKKSE
jgi:uncharacterized membrane protein YhaH (DUF805 family)